MLTKIDTFTMTSTKNEPTGLKIRESIYLNVDKIAYLVPLNDESKYVFAYLQSNNGERQLILNSEDLEKWM